MPGGEERAEHGAAQCAAERCWRAMPRPPSRTRPRRGRRGRARRAGGVVAGERAGDGREAPHQRHEHDALDAAPAVREQRQRHGAERDRDRDDGDQAAELAVGQAPLRLEVREHRHDDLAVDVVDDHQRDQDREDPPRIAARRKRVLREHGAGVRGRRCAWAAFSRSRARQALTPRDGGLSFRDRAGGPDDAASSAAAA